MPVERFLRPMKTRGVEVSGPHTANVEQEMARQTEALVWRNGGALQWVTTYAGQPNIYNTLSPVAKITAVNTWYDFKEYYTVVDQASYMLPYRMHEGFDKIMGVVTIVTEATCRLVLRLVITDCVDNITEVNGDESTPCYATETSRMMHWSALSNHIGQRFYRASRVCYVTPDDYSSPETGPSRVMCIKPQVAIYEEDYGIFGTGDAKTHVRLQSLDLCDVPADSVGV